jgi:hypothetical protein
MWTMAFIWEMMAYIVGSMILWDEKAYWGQISRRGGRGVGTSVLDRMGHGVQFNVTTVQQQNFCSRGDDSDPFGLLSVAQKSALFRRCTMVQYKTYNAADRRTEALKWKSRTGES